MTWIGDNLGLILDLTAVHLRQSLIALVLGFIIALPLGRLAWRYRLVRGPIILLTGLLYTIPSLALLILLPALLGYSAISETNLVVALAIYAVAILVRAVADGLDSVDDDVRQAATATGFAPFRRFWAVEFPLAGPVVLAIGLVAHLLVRDLLRRIVALNIASGGVMMVLLAIAARSSAPDPVPQALVLTGIVIMAATSGVALAFARRVESESDELDTPDDDVEQGEQS